LVLLSHTIRSGNTREFQTCTFSFQLTVCHQGLIMNTGTRICLFPAAYSHVENTFLKNEFGSPHVGGEPGRHINFDHRGFVLRVRHNGFW
jgi:hypothetical protein